MRAMLLVALGGGFGSVARFKLSELMLLHYPNWKFPLGTFLVNVTGCLVIGALAALGERPGFFTPETRVLLFTGVLGGFTTFSAFGLETFTLIRRGEVLIAGSYVALSVIAGILAVSLGFLITESATR